MEQRFYKVRLSNGRVIGPIDLDRVRMFIAKDKITGLEVARLYPTGDWKDINTYPEIAEILMQKLEGKLSLTATPDKGGENDGNTMSSLEDPGGPQVNIPVPPTAPDMEYPGTPQLNVAEHEPESPNPSRTVQAGPPPEAAAEPAATPEDDEKTVFVTADEERTVFVTSPKREPAPFQMESDVSEEPVIADPQIAAEKTAMLTRPEVMLDPAKAKKGPAKPTTIMDHKKKIVAGIAIVIAALIMTSDDDKAPVDPGANFHLTRVELPAVRQTQDQVKSESILKEGMKLYLQDTVEGYNRAAVLFKDSASWDTNNVKALCMLASCYMNLFDVIERNAAYFNTVTALIERERAKGIDLAETVIADVELYLMLGNAEAAYTRIVDFTKTHSWGPEMIYYLALVFYTEGKNPEALQQLNKIERKDFFSPKIAFLFGLIYERTGQYDEAIKAYLYVIGQSKTHIKAHVQLAGIYFSKDNLPESGKHADFVIQHKWLASVGELSKAYYYRSRMRLVAKHELDALQDLEQARKLAPDDHDILLDFYTLKAKEVGSSKVKEAPALAKMFFFLAQGEKALKDENMEEAMAQFLSAREANDKDPAPLVRLANVFLKKGDPQDAIINLAKAKALAPKDRAIFSKYVQTLIEGYELDEAQAQMVELTKQQGVEANLLDKLYGQIFLKQEKFQEAASYLKRALQSNNFDSSVYVAFGSLMFKTNNFSDAAFYMGLAQRFDPFNVEATVTIGKSLSEMDSVDKGVEYINQAIQNSPHKAELLNGIGELYFRKSKNEDAVKYADNALAIDPKCALAHKTKGLALGAMGKRKEAIDELETYTNMAPLDPTGHIERQKLFLMPDEKGRLDLAAAKTELLKVIRLFPHYPGVHFTLGNLFYRTGDLEKASDQAEEEIKGNPSYVDAYILEASIQNKLKEYLKASERAETVLKMDPGYAPALLQDGIANHGLKRYAAAQAMLERAITLDPGNADCYMAMGRLYYDLSKYKEMKAMYKKYLELYPDAPEKQEVEDYLKKVGG